MLLWPGGNGGVFARLDVVELLLRGERAALPGRGERLRLGALRGLRAPADELRLRDRVVLLPRELLRRGQRERLQARGGVAAAAGAGGSEAAAAETAGGDGGAGEKRELKVERATEGDKDSEEPRVGKRQRTD